MGEMETAKEEMSGRLTLVKVLHGHEVVEPMNEHPIFVPSIRSDNNYSPHNLSLAELENVQDYNVWMTAALNDPNLEIIVHQQEQSAVIAINEVDTPPANK